MVICSYTGPNLLYVWKCTFSIISDKRNTWGVLGDAGDDIFGQNGSCPLVIMNTETFPIGFCLEGLIRAEMLFFNAVTIFVGV